MLRRIRGFDFESLSVSTLAVGAFAVLSALSVREIWTRHYPRGDFQVRSVHEGIDYHSGAVLLGISLAIALLSAFRVAGPLRQRTYLALAAPLATVALLAVLWVRFWIVGDIDFQHPSPRSRGGHFIPGDDGLDMALVATTGMLVSLAATAVASRLSSARPLDLRARLAGLFALIAAGASVAPWISGHSWTENGLAQRECVLGLAMAWCVWLVLAAQADARISVSRTRRLVAVFAFAAAAGAIWFDVVSVGDPDPYWDNFLINFNRLPRSGVGIGLRVSEAAWLACALSQCASWRGTRRYLDGIDLRRRSVDIRRAVAWVWEGRFFRSPS